MKIAFIGTGTMGRPMLRNLLLKQFSAIAYDVVPAALDAAAALGADRAASPAEAAAAADLVVTMLPSSANVEAVYFGSGGVAEGAKPGSLCVDMSTIDPGVSQSVAARLAGRGLRFLDAPVSGGVGGAEAGTLAIMVGGAPADLDEARPVLAAMGANIIHVGAAGAGEVAKLCNNLIAGVAGLHDRPDGQGYRPRTRRGARRAGADPRGRRGAPALPHGLGARPRPQGLRRRLPVPPAIGRRRAGLMPADGRR
jgi:3-hydroxyisobutyrate dehydrogenase